MVYILTVFFFSSKYSLLHNYNIFGSCIIHILYTGCAKIKKKIIPAPNVYNVLVSDTHIFPFTESFPLRQTFLIERYLCPMACIFPQR